MTGRRRKWLIAAVGLVLVAALGWASFGRAGKMEVKLIFIRYANSTNTFIKPGSSVLTSYVFSAVVMATNCGNVAVELHALVRPQNLAGSSMEWSDDFAVPMGPKPPRILMPGEAALVEVVPQTLGVPWRTEIMAQRRGFRDRLYVKAWAKGGGAVQRIMSAWLSPPPELWPALGPITNAPLDKHSIRYFFEPYIRRHPAENLLDEENE